MSTPSVFIKTIHQKREYHCKLLLKRGYLIDDNVKGSGINQKLEYTNIRQYRNFTEWKMAARENVSREM